MTHPKLWGGLDLLLFHNLSGANDAAVLKLNDELQTYEFCSCQIQHFLSQIHKTKSSLITLVFLTGFNDSNVKKHV